MRTLPASYEDILAGLKGGNAITPIAIPYLCCDCLYGGPICDASENQACPRRKEDGSCWMAFTEKEEAK